MKTCVVQFPLLADKNRKHDKCIYTSTFFNRKLPLINFSRKKTVWANTAVSLCQAGMDKNTIGRDLARYLSNYFHSDKLYVRNRKKTKERKKSRNLLVWSYKLLARSILMDKISWTVKSPLPGLELCPSSSVYQRTTSRTRGRRTERAVLPPAGSASSASAWPPTLAGRETGAPGFSPIAHTQTHTSHLLSWSRIKPEYDWSYH